MTNSLVEVSSVVVANAHNPSILNPDWLKANDMLQGNPQGWELAEPPFTTPALSRIHFLNGVLLVLDATRLSLTFNLPVEEVEHPEQLIVSLAKAYVETLQHIPYAAVGSNFKAVLACESAKEVLVRKFGNTGVWRERLEALSVKLVHPLNQQCRRTVEIAPTLAEEDEGQGVLLAANYHRKTTTYTSTARALGKVDEDLTDFKQFVATFEGELNG